MLVTVIPLRRLAVTLVTLAALVVPSMVTMWAFTPSADDVQLRVHARADTLGVALLNPDGIPPVLAQARERTEAAGLPF